MSSYYRAVFLRVHPTGKSVLSLTQGPDGKESQYADIAANLMGVPTLDVKVVPADTDRFGVGHGYSSAPSNGTAAAVAKATEKVMSKAQRMAGMALGVPADQVSWDGTAFVSGGKSASMEDIALYTFGTGELPPGDEGFLDGQCVYAD